jgi:hypothetical protein
MMNKRTAMFTAAIVALTLGGLAAAADEDQENRQQPLRQVADPAAGGATASQREWEYLAALQKCEPRTGAEKARCIDEAKKKYGEM